MFQLITCWVCLIRHSAIDRRCLKIKEFLIENIDAVITFTVGLLGVVSGVFISKMQNKFTYKLKATEMYITEKIKAYTALIECASEYYDYTNEKIVLKQIYEKADSALLLSSNETFRDIVDFMTCTRELIDTPFTNVETWTEKTKKFYDMKSLLTNKFRLELLKFANEKKFF